MSTLWLIVIFAVVGAIILARLYFTLRKHRPQHAESWDEMMMARLRTQGYAPFNHYPVDFFLALPDEGACNAVRAPLESQGFSVDVRPIEEEADLPFSLHATRSMQLILADMVEHSRRFSALAEEHHGRYDGWAA